MKPKASDVQAAQTLPATKPQASAQALEPTTIIKEKRVSKRIAEVVKLILTGECKTQKAASERVGMNASHVSEMLKKPHVRVFIERASRETIAAGTMRASARLVELLDAGSEHVSLDASKHMLAIAGIKPAAEAQVSVNIEIKAGYVIDLSENHERQPDRPMQIIDNATGLNRD